MIRATLVYNKADMTIPDDIIQAHRAKYIQAMASRASAVRDSAAIPTEVRVASEARACVDEVMARFTQMELDEQIARSMAQAEFAEIQNTEAVAPSLPAVTECLLPSAPPVLVREPRHFRIM